MSDFCTASLSSTASALYKRVRYTTGLVLGVDEFEQDQAYLMERDRLHQRALHGYGTVHGLSVTLAPDDGSGAGPEVRVAPGLAIDPHGQHICVPETQCARLDDWLATQTGEDIDLGSPPTGRVSLYVVLRYRACATDAVPLPGQPCRSLDDTMAASRFADDFALDFTFERPPHVEERVLRLFGDLLNAIQVSEPETPVDRDDMLSLIRALADTEPGETLQDLLNTLDPEGSPPSPGDLFVQPEQSRELFRAMTRVWATEVRPLVLRTGREDDPLDIAYREEGAGRCSSVPDGDDSVLLAEISVEVEATSDGLQRVPGTGFEDIDVIERDRPILIATRLLQEGPAAFPGGGGSGGGSGPGPIALDDLTDVAIPDPGALTDRVLGWDDVDGRWEPVALPSPTTDHGSMSGLTDDDHPQYLLVDPGDRSLAENLDASGNRITNLAASSAATDAVRQDEAVLDGDPALGDLDGSYPDPTVVALRGRTLSEIAPSPGQVLTWSEDSVSGDGEWTPQTVSGGAGSPREEEDLVRIVAVNWVHGEPSDVQVEVDGNLRYGLAIGFGRSVDEPAAVQRATLNANTVQVFVDDFDPALLGGEGGFRRIRINIDPIIHIQNYDVNDGRIVALESTEEELVTGVFLPLMGGVLETLPAAQLDVVLRGNFVLDEEGRAVDAEHVRGQLPSGDRPGGIPIGVQGGRFESWLEVQQTVIDLNTATLEELQTLPRIGPSLAESITAYRDDAGGFSRVDELTEVSGIGDSLLNDIRTRVRV